MEFCEKILKDFKELITEGFKEISFSNLKTIEKAKFEMLYILDKKGHLTVADYYRCCKKAYDMHNELIGFSWYELYDDYGWLKEELVDLKPKIMDGILNTFIFELPKPHRIPKTNDIARQVLADMAGVTEDDTSDDIAKKIIFGTDNDPVNHPSHYISEDGMEVIDVIKAFTKHLSGIEAVCTANAIKYILRWHNKNGAQDLKKAAWYIGYLIEEVEKKGEN